MRIFSEVSSCWFLKETQYMSHRVLSWYCSSGHSHPICSVIVISKHQTLSSDLGIYPIQTAQKKTFAWINCNTLFKLSYYCYNSSPLTTIITQLLDPRIRITIRSLEAEGWWAGIGGFTEMITRVWQAKRSI